MNKKKQMAAALLVAASLGDINLVVFLLNNGADINTRDREHGETPLMLALNAKKLDVATLLVERGANINAVDNLGRTALTFATHGQMREFVAFLLESGIDCQHENTHGEQPLTSAVANANIDIVRIMLLYKRCISIDSLRQAIDTAHTFGLGAIEALLQDTLLQQHDFSLTNDVDE